jgi:hypothetical protein
MADEYLRPDDGSPGLTDRAAANPPARRDDRAAAPDRLELEALHELYAPDGPEDDVRSYTRRGWARRWPGEEVWVARRTSG